MDQVLIEYLLSGKAWILVGSGPSSEMRYPSWKDLAAHAIQLVEREGDSTNIDEIKRSFDKGSYPKVFDQVGAVVGLERLLAELRSVFRPKAGSRLYELITKWPVPVYLTTNYDNEIQDHLAKIGEAYEVYGNSADHMNYLTSDLNGAIYKLHGDLRWQDGLILTEMHYNEILKSEKWRHWRNKMTSVFQMSRLIVLGHSLTDPNIQHVIEAAKHGAGVHQPVVWIAPDVQLKEARNYLEKFRIRVLSYDNRDGTHLALIRLVESLTDFIPPRSVIRIQDTIARVRKVSLTMSDAAPGFFVFNKIASTDDFEKKRINVVLAGLQSVIPALREEGVFDVETALKMVGWPSQFQSDAEFLAALKKAAIEQGLFTQTTSGLVVANSADQLTSELRSSFEHARRRFKESVKLRSRQKFSQLGDSDAEKIAGDLETALVGFFREGGLTLASTLLASSDTTEQHGSIPASIIKFVVQVSTQYGDLLMRQAFVTAAFDIVARPTAADREYLGRISQGYFAFHALGVFGPAAFERLRLAKETVWLVDSDLQIFALALGTPLNSAIRSCFNKLKTTGVRLFSTQRLFNEVFTHFRFAHKVVSESGCDSQHVISAANGQAPYRKSNQFLQGFIRWQAAGYPCDWAEYCSATFGARKPQKADIQRTLNSAGIEVIHFSSWPGFDSLRDDELHEQYVQRIVTFYSSASETDSDADEDPRRKAEPEAETLVIIKNEKDGLYHVLSAEPSTSDAWFISHTSILNLVEGKRITWQPEGFLRFISTLAPTLADNTSDDAFEAILLGVASSGLILIDEEIISRVFGRAIDQTKLDMEGLKQEYTEHLEQKYGEPLESVLERVPPSRRQLGALQLAEEMLQRKEEKEAQLVRKMKESEKETIAARKEAEKAKKKEKHWRKEARRARLDKKSKGKKKRGY